MVALALLKNNIHYKVNLNQWEIKILKSIKSKSKTEKKNSKQVRLNTSIVSQLITDLMNKGYTIRTGKRRMFFFYSEYFSTMQDGLRALEVIKRSNDNNNTFRSHIMSIIGCYSKASLE
jgi:hypothetical protein